MFPVGVICVAVITGFVVVGQLSFGISMHEPHELLLHVSVPGQFSFVVQFLVSPLVHVVGHPSFGMSMHVPQIPLEQVCVPSQFSVVVQS